MRARRQAYRFMGSALLGLSSIAACVGGIPEGGARGAASGAASQSSPVSGKKAPDESKPKAARQEAPVSAAAAKRFEETRSKGTAASIASDIRCPHGVLEDPHRGYVRCLGPDEKGAKWLPPSPQPAPPPLAASGSSTGSSGGPAASASASAAPALSAAAAPPAFTVPPPAQSAAALLPEAPAATAPASTAPPSVEIKPPTFENGDVPRAEKTVTKLAEEIGMCVAKNGGLSRASGTMKVQFIVRARGRAEGVEILSSQGVSAEATSCVRLLLKNRSVGAPTDDPVGVTFVINLKAAPK